ncbi:MAG: DNA polymerase IV [Clostridiales bacterium]|jgi:DNA polymerase-4|nr:DNA polymerase IV [Clostridiales bacterium]
MDRTILHCDLNGFYASVEILNNPSFKNVPMAVAGDPDNRHGIILAKNEIAKKFGVKTAETIWQAKKKCPDLVLAPPHMGEYKRYSLIVNGIYNEYTDLVEPFGIDESFLDITNVMHLFGTGVQVADKIRKAVKIRTGLTISVGVSFNKIFAKLGSDYKKPDATTLISRENYKSVVFPLPVTDLLYVGKSVSKSLSRLNISTIGDLADSDKELIMQTLGKMGAQLWDYSNGLDDSPVRPFEEESRAKSIGCGMTFKRDLVTPEDIKTGVIALCEELSFRMRKEDVKCRTVAVSIRFADFKHISRQKGLKYATNFAIDMWRAAYELIESVEDLRPIRTLTVTGANLNDDYNDGPAQLSLFDMEDVKEEEETRDDKKKENLEQALFDIRNKFGRNSVISAAKLKNDIGVE